MTQPDELLKSLQESDHATLQALLVDAAREVPTMRAWLQDRQAVATKDAPALLQLLDGAIQCLVPDERRGALPMWAYFLLDDDTSRVERLVAAAQKQGLHDELLQRVPLLINAGEAQRQVLYKDDCAGNDVALVLASVLQSLRHSSMPPAEQILFADALARDDGYDLLPTVAQALRHCNDQAWRDAAASNPLSIRRCE